jgi:hypothetical protein
LLVVSDFGFAVPSDATIRGVSVRIERRSHGGRVSDGDVRLTTGAFHTGHRGRSSLWPTVLSYESYGGSTDLWGRFWSPAEVNAGGFGVVGSAFHRGGDPDQAEVHHVEVTVHYRPMCP